jgi:hypothetical protein
LNTYLSLRILYPFVSVTLALWRSMVCPWALLRLTLRKFLIKEIFERAYIPARGQGRVNGV